MQDLLHQDFIDAKRDNMKAENVPLFNAVSYISH